MLVLRVFPVQDHQLCAAVQERAGVVPCYSPVLHLLLHQRALHWAWSVASLNVDLTCTILYIYVRNNYSIAAFVRNEQ